MLPVLFHRFAASAADFTHLRQANVELRNVIKRCGAHSVLNGVSLAVEPGEMVTILGSSGSGKSALIRLINQLESLNDGETFIDDRPISQLRGAALRQLRSRIGFVFQQSNLYSHLTVLQNIALALEYAHDWNKTEAKRRALELLEKVGLAEKANVYAAQLPGGQQQRVAITRALASSPQIILFDGPASVLDPEMVGEVLQVMRNLTHSGITMIVVTRETHFAREIADRVVFADSGDIPEVVPSEDFSVRLQHPRTQHFLKKVLDPLHQESSS